MRLGDLCARPVRSVAAEADLAAAWDLFVRFGDEHLLVVRGRRPLGLLWRHAVAKARRFSLPLSVEDLVSSEVPVARGGEEARPERLDLLLRNPLRRALVVEETGPPGLLSPETVVFSGLALPPPATLRGELSPSLRDFLRWCGAAAADLGLAVHLVGGAVRDLLLGREPLDLDLVVAGDPEPLGARLAADLGARRRKRSPFGTLKFELGGREVDLARARWEEYVTPASLPSVVPGSLLEDLFRRDFTANALALCLAPERFARVLDPLGGERDVARGLLRVHHPLSFVDDPTRIFRAARYAVRFRWRLSEATHRALALALRLDVLRLLSPARLRNEWARVLEEDDPAGVLRWLGTHGVLWALLPAPPDEGTLDRLFSLGRFVAGDVRLEALALVLAGEEADRLFGLAPGRLAFLLREEERLAARRGFLLSGGPLSEKVFFLERLPRPVILAAGARDPELFSLVERCLAGLFALRPCLTGRDLRRAGVAPGPRLGEMLKRLRAARLDGLVRDEAGEWDLLRKEFPDVLSP